MLLMLISRIAILAMLVLALAGAAWAAEVFFIQEDFDGEAGYFYEGAIGDTDFAYNREDAYYEIDAMRSDTGSLSALTDAFENYTISVDMEFYDSIVSDKIYGGLVFHYQEDPSGRASFYLFSIFPDGYYCVWLVNRESRRTYAYPLTETSLINPAGRNSLKVISEGTRFELYLNGMLLDSFRDLSLDKGGVGMFASAGARVRFRAFRWRVREEEYEARMEEAGIFGFVREHELPVVFSDNFTSKRWLEGQSAKARFGYREGRYEIDNTKGDTMAVSYRAEPVAGAGLLSAIITDVEGEEGNGYGIAFRFSLHDKKPSYYAFIVARDGTYRLFKYADGTATPLCGWQEIPFAVDFSRPQLIGVAYVPEAAGTLRIFPGLNGRALEPFVDTVPLEPGGFAMIVAPKLKVTLSEIRLVDFADSEELALETLSALYREENDDAG